MNFDDYMKRIQYISNILEKNKYAEDILNSKELDIKKVYTDTKDYPLSIIKEMFDDGDIIPQPDYQRDYIMDEKKASKLIESVLLQIPIPTVYLCEESDGTLSIIDGQQRLTSFVKFLKCFLLAFIILSSSLAL